ncbi:MAG: hypothetical protein KGH64_03385 [Candidatus Micrarchaeota archaeon]|nr:hypothetical protein [Candidatus Micrarchaeota archaeon]MDE1834355.1 hypothetical protein [Candidatus Micrarchaeota archaeon]MDE1859707.1 hypothetical protein [Candidatus Micrarchaeota archaeon]
MKLQSALEYLTTYGWAILILALAVVALFEIFSPKANPVCIFPAGFACLNYYMAQNGMLVLNLLQSTQAPVQLTAVGCNQPESLGNMAPPQQPGFTPTNMPIGSNYTFQIQCYSNGSSYSGQIGQAYSGYIVLNYTDEYTSLPQTVYGSVTAKIIK